MTPDSSHILVTLAIYKVACLAVGLAFGVMGYRLFMSGVVAAAGDLEARGGAPGNVGLLRLANAAPGTFFALFGAVVVAFVVFRGIEFEIQPGRSQPSAANVFPLDILPEKSPLDRN